QWRLTLLIASALTLVGGLVADRLAGDGPYATRASPFDPRQIRAIVAERRFRLASAGYFGHMWELYAMWAWAAAFYGDVFASDRAASLAAFAVIAIGAAGSMHAGLISDRLGRPEAAAVALRWSSSVALVIGFLVEAPWPVVLAVGLVWGYWVVADSAQFSTIVTEVTDPGYVGTALTLQLAVGFVLTVFTIFLVPVVRDAWGWGWAFAMLAPGPLLGSWAMRRLRAMGPVAERAAAPTFVSPYF
ncbi:MAG: MFS transporter, partial [Actinomycetota bacterium]